MKYFSLFFYLISSLFFSAICVANASTQNAEGVTLIFLDDNNNVTQEVLLNAMSLEGIKYKYGGSSPETGFDCSGFVNYVYSKSANLKLPRTSRGISRMGYSVNKQELQPGDLVFFNTAKRAFSHVGIYVGDGKFIHAPRTGSFVRVESMQTSYWKNRFNGAKRLDQVATN
ncbi:MAG: C40 family peptidase [Methylophilaceae bacterium]